MKAPVLLKSLVNRTRFFLSYFRRSNQVRIYIVPTWFCFAFNSVVVLTAVIGVSLQLYSVLAACLLIVFVELLSMIEAHVNLRDLNVLKVEAQSAQAFAPTSMTIMVESSSQTLGVSFRCVSHEDVFHTRKMSLLPRHLGAYAKEEILNAFLSFRDRYRKTKVEEANISAAGKNMDLTFEAGKRSIHRLPKVIASSLFPFGMFRVWREFSFVGVYAAFPIPSGVSRISKVGSATNNNDLRENLTKLSPQSEIDYSHHREYLPGDHLSRIDWRASSKSSKAQVRVYSGQSGDSNTVLKWSDTSGNNGEARLSQLALWLYEAFEAKQSFSLEMPGLEVPSGVGERHLKRCLTVLADFDLDRALPGGQL